MGLAAIEKSDGAEVTVSETVVDSTVPSNPVPVTVTVDVPTEAFAAAVKVRVVLPFPAKEFGLKPAVTPAGKPEVENETAEL